MSHRVVAQSLSALNELADAPPQYPPLQLQGEAPLVLYIARVPGSRDIFLTPMKPRSKVVSAQDVQSSLYYCHLNGSRDETMLSDEDKSQDIFQGTARSNGNHMPSAIAGETPTLPPRPISMACTITRTAVFDMPRSSHTIKRKQVKPIEHGLFPSRSNLTSEKPRILGPRPLNYQDRPPQSLDSRQRIDNLVNLDDVNGKNSAVESQNATERSLGKANSLSVYASSCFNNHSITMIRRNPATGEQWNIGSVSSENLQPRAFPSRGPKKRRHDIQLDLSAQGYSRFVREADDGNGSCFQRYVRFNKAGEGNSGSTPHTNDNLQCSFLSPWQTPCSFRTTASGRVLKCYNSLPTSSRSSMTGKNVDNSASMLVSELRFNLPNLVDREVKKKKENRRPLSYSAHSSSRTSLLWNRRTSIFGSAYEQGPNDWQQSPRLPPRPVSYQERSHSRPHLSPRPHHSNTRCLQTSAYLEDFNDLDEEEDDFPDTEMDLSLGQERAGGGFSGNKAKLGKLIIYGGQGLAMLDLLVSANMGIWFNDILGQEANSDGG